MENRKINVTEFYRVLDTGRDEEGEEVEDQRSYRSHLTGIPEHPENQEEPRAENFLERDSIASV